MARFVVMPRLVHFGIFNSAKDGSAVGLDDRRAVGRRAVLKPGNREIARIARRMVADQPVGERDQIGGADLGHPAVGPAVRRSAEHTSELQSLMRISYADFCLNKKQKLTIFNNHVNTHIYTDSHPLYHIKVYIPINNVIT